MDAKAVHDAVARLRAELADAEALTPELRAELSVALRDVERALGRSERPLAVRAEELAARLEAEHPKLAESISALMRGLAGIGI